MRTSVKTVMLAGCTLILLTVAGIYTRAKSGPVREGHSLAYWIHAHGTGEGQSQQEAARAICEIGTNGLPYLLQWLSYHPTKWRDRLRAVRDPGGRPPRWWIPAWLTSAKGFARADEALVAFDALGPAATPAIPQLAAIARGNDLESVWRALEALPFVGIAAIPDLLLIHGDTNLTPNVRSAASHALDELIIRRLTGKYAESNSRMPENLIGLENNDLNLWEYLETAEALAVLKRHPEISVPALVKALSESRPAVRSLALRLLARFGPQSHPALPAIRRALDDPDQVVRETATNAVRMIERDR